MEEIHRLLLKRNAVETDPFVLVHAANATLLNQVDALQAKCDSLERHCAEQQQQLESGAASGSSGNHRVATAALKSEARLREKVEKLQGDLNDKLRLQSEGSEAALKTAKELSGLKDVTTAQQATISNLKEENERSEKAIERLTNELQDAESRTKLAEKQYDGLKQTIRTLQEENDSLKAENSKLIGRLVDKKETTSDEVNVLNEMVEKLKKEVDMLRSLKVQEEKRRKWFGKAAVKDETETGSSETKAKGSSARRFGSMGTVVPLGPKHTIKAHSSEAPCVRYDNSGADLAVTCSSDNTVKVWETNSGACKATFRGGSGHVMTCCDIGGGAAVGGSSDKTCRVWNLRTDRMIHHLVGHSSKITCVRLFEGEKAVLTASADRSMKVWDIHRSTYRQTTTLRHSSTAYGLDVASDGVTTVSGHMDGGIRFWDVRTGERTADIAGLHEGGITSVQFNPKIGTQVLTNGKDSCLKVVDIRTCTAIHTLSNPEFRTGYSWSSAAFSPDGAYAASGSSAPGDVFVWRVADGKLERRLGGHTAGVASLAWGRGGSSGQQVASVDKRGTLILWA